MRRPTCYNVAITTKVEEFKVLGSTKKQVVREGLVPRPSRFYVCHLTGCKHSVMLPSQKNLFGQNEWTDRGMYLHYIIYLLPSPETSTTPTHVISYKDE